MDKEIDIKILDSRKIFAGFAVISCLLGLIILATTFLQKPLKPDQIFSNFQTYQGDYILFATLSLSWSVFTFPVIISIGILLRNTTNSVLCYTASILTGLGVLLNGIVSFLYVGALLSAWNSKNIGGTNAEYDMTFWTNLFYFMTDPALMIWGLGQFLFGIILYKQAAFPKWLSINTLTGGIAGVLTLVVYQTPILAILQAITFVILTIYFCLALLKNRLQKT
jgi:hypothetical protein